MAKHVEAMLRLPGAWACRPSTTATTSARWPRTRASRDAFDFPGFVPAYIRPLFCRGIGPFRWAALSGDPEDIYKTDAKVQGADARRSASAPLARHGARRASSSRACRRASAGSASASATASASRSTRWWRSGRAEGADRDRPRPSRLRLGRQPEPRDRGDAGRLRRRLRLAAAERAAEHRVGRHLGVASPRRRRRHGLSRSTPAW